MRAQIIPYVLFCILCIACTPERQPIKKESTASPKRTIDLLANVASVGMEKGANYLHFAQFKPLSWTAGEIAKAQLKSLQSAAQNNLTAHFKVLELPKNKAVPYLNFTGLERSFLPENLSAYRQLRVLNLKENQLKSLPPNLKNCKDLRKINLSSNGLQKLPPTIYTLENLEELVLQDNKFSSLPSALKKLKKLKVLDLSNLHPADATGYNNFIKLPNLLLYLDRIQRIFAERLPLKTLPQGMGNLKDLRVLSVAGCRALELNRAIAVLASAPQITALNISFIGRKSLPVSIQKLKHLRVLIWHEEGSRNAAFIPILKKWLPNTKIYYGKKGVATPFLRGSSLSVLNLN